MKKGKRKSKKATTTEKPDSPAETTSVTLSPQNPLDAAVRLTATELLKLGKISAEMRLALVNARVAVFEAKELQAKAEAEVAKKQEAVRIWLDEELRKREGVRLAHLDEAKRLRAIYDQLTSLLATKYGIEDPKHMVVDPDTGVIRDSRNL